MNIPISEILVDHANNTSRVPFAPETCEDLAANIGQHGQLVPVKVRPIDHPNFKYQLVMGYRRITACSVILGWEQIEAIVDNNVTEEDANLHNLIENLQRKGLGYWEECQSLRRTFPPEMGDTEIARKLNMSRGWVRARWLVWRLPQEVIDQVEAGLLSPADVTLLIHRSPEEQQAAAKRLLEGKAAGETTQSMVEELSRRRGVRTKAQVQEVMVKLLEMEKKDAMHALRWAIGEITDTALYEHLK